MDSLWTWQPYKYVFHLQLKSILMAIYFAGDHVVWASQAGLYTDKEGTEK